MRGRSGACPRRRLTPPACWPSPSYRKRSMARKALVEPSTAWPRAWRAGRRRGAGWAPPAPRGNGPRAIVLGRGFNFSTAEEIALKLTETSYLLARAWSVADFEHGPIAVVEPGFPVLLVDGHGKVSADMESIGRRLRDQSCRVVWLLDGISD